MPAGLVDQEVGQLEARRPEAAGPPQDRADPGQELLEREGLADIVVGTEPEPCEPVCHRLACRREHDRHVAPVAQPAGEGEPVHSAEPDVQDDEVRLDLEDLVGPVGVRERADQEPVAAQRPGDRVAQGLVVLDDGDPDAPLAHLGKCARPGLKNG